MYPKHKKMLVEFPSRNVSNFHPWNFNFTPVHQNRIFLEVIGLNN